jgi:hypothetical protein
VRWFMSYNSTTKPMGSLLGTFQIHNNNDSTYHITYCTMMLYLFMIKIKRMYNQYSCSSLWYFIIKRRFTSSTFSGFNLSIDTLITFNLLSQMSLASFWKMFWAWRLSEGRRNYGRALETIPKLGCLKILFNSWVTFFIRLNNFCSPSSIYAKID